MPEAPQPYGLDAMSTATLTPRRKWDKPCADFADAPECHEVLGAELISTHEVAKACGVSEQTIDIWRNRKGLPYVVIAGSKRKTVRYREARVRAWCERRALPFNR